MAAYNMKQYVFMYSTLLGSMFSGASIVHNILKPDLTLPTLAKPAEAPASATAGGDKPDGSAASGGPGA
jgi:hypothetical protein